MIIFYLFYSSGEQTLQLKKKCFWALPFIRTTILVFSVNTVWPFCLLLIAAAAALLLQWAAKPLLSAAGCSCCSAAKSCPYLLRCCCCCRTCSTVLPSPGLTSRLSLSTNCSVTAPAKGAYKHYN